MEQQKKLGANNQLTYVGDSSGLNDLPGKGNGFVHDVLELEIELESWSRIQSIRPDGSVTKQILRHGRQDSPCPQLGALARLCIAGRAGDGAVIVSRTSKEPLEVQVGTGQAFCIL